MFPVQHIKMQTKEECHGKLLAGEYGMDGNLCVAEFFIDTFAPFFNICEKGRGGDVFYYFWHI